MRLFEEFAKPGMSFEMLPRLCANEPRRARERDGAAREGVAAFREALQERTRERVPLDWADTQNNLGLALVSLAEREKGRARA